MHRQLDLHIDKDTVWALRLCAVCMCTMYVVFRFLFLVVSTSAIDYLKRLVSEMTYYGFNTLRGISICVLDQQPNKTLGEALAMIKCVCSQHMNLIGMH